ncbi:MAG: hypothetical protein ACXV45_08095 [Halobacteriota archaeon]
MAACVVIIIGIDAPKMLFGVATILVAMPLYVVVFWHQERERGVAHPLSQEEINAQVERSKFSSGTFLRCYIGVYVLGEDAAKSECDWIATCSRFDG